MVADKTFPAEDPNGFAAHLLETGKLTSDAYNRALSSARKTQDSLVSVLSKLGFLTEPDLVEALASFYDITSVPANAFPSEPLFSESINDRFLLHHAVVPLSDDEKTGLVVAMADPGDDAAAQAIGFFSGRPVTRRVAALTDITAAIHKLYGSSASQSHQATDKKRHDERAHEDIKKLTDLASDAPVIRFVHALITKAVEQGASDVHIEPFEDRVRVRLRLDGFLREEESQPRESGEAITSRIKIMAQMNIAEKRLAQDGRLRFTVRGKDVDIRVSTSPTVHGESVVLRILDRGGLVLDFKTLGLDDFVLNPLYNLLTRPHGILLVTGPTGSGKTTTLYTALLSLNTPDKKILTVEDPVEYILDGINQLPVQASIGRTFASSLRSFLRQDPDIIMVGEIRDTETAQISVQAALTGHLILSTLHTNDAASAATRLLDMGVEDYLLTSTLSGVVGQRLVRRLCPHCREPYKPMSDMVAKLFAGEHKLPKNVAFYRPVGCSHCHGTGYSGRTTIVELLEMNDAIRHLVLKRAEAQDIQRAAVANGMRTMYRHGLSKVLEGITSIEEVLRVTQET